MMLTVCSGIYKQTTSTSKNLIHVIKDGMWPVYIRNVWYVFGIWEEKWDWVCVWYTKVIINWWCWKIKIMPTEMTVSVRYMVNITGIQSVYVKKMSFGICMVYESHSTFKFLRITVYKWYMKKSGIWTVCEQTNAMCRSILNFFFAVMLCANKTTTKLILLQHCTFLFLLPTECASLESWINWRLHFDLLWNDSLYKHDGYLVYELMYIMS